MDRRLRALPPFSSAQEEGTAFKPPKLPNIILVLHLLHIRSSYFFLNRKVLTLIRQRFQAIMSRSCARFQPIISGPLTNTQCPIKYLIEPSYYWPTPENSNIEGAVKHWTDILLTAAHNYDVNEHERFKAEIATEAHMAFNRWIKAICWHRNEPDNDYSAPLVLTSKEKDELQFRHNSYCSSVIPAAVTAILEYKNGNLPCRHRGSTSAILRARDALRRHRDHVERDLRPTNDFVKVLQNYFKGALSGKMGRYMTDGMRYVAELKKAIITSKCTNIELDLH